MPTDEHGPEGQPPEKSPAGKVVPGPKAWIREIAGIRTEEKHEAEVFGMLELAKTPDDRYYPKKLFTNLVTILRHDTRWAGRLWYNEFDTCKYIDQRRIVDVDFKRAALWLGRVYQLHMGWRQVADAFDVVCDDHRVHPVRDYLGGLTWDGQERCHRLLPEWIGTADTPLIRSISKRWMISCVARVLEPIHDVPWSIREDRSAGGPGCKVDTVLVLVGDQGQYKSTAFGLLCGGNGGRDWFSDTPVNIRHEKDAFEKIQGKWVYEFAELTSVRKTDVEAVKAFISSPVDRYRAAFGRETADRPRQGIIVGSTNNPTFLNDPTGDRRYWPVLLERDADPNAIRVNRDQLWAEAVHWYRSKIPWFLGRREETARREHSAVFRQEHPWESLIEQYVEPTRNDVTVAQILEHAIKKEPGKWTRSDEMTVAPLLAKLGFKVKRVQRNGKRHNRWIREVRPEPVQEDLEL